MSQECRKERGAFVGIRVSVRSVYVEIVKKDHGVPVYGAREGLQQPLV